MPEDVPEVRAATRKVPYGCVGTNNKVPMRKRPAGSMVVAERWRSV